MIYLLDTNVLIARLSENHEFYQDVIRWEAGKKFAICPLSGLGFLRISCSPTGPIKATMAEAKENLTGFLTSRKCAFVPDDIPAELVDTVASSKQITDHYLASLAAKHKMKLATFDGKINHPAVEVIPVSPPATPRPSPASAKQK